MRRSQWCRRLVWLIAATLMAGCATTGSTGGSSSSNRASRAIRSGTTASQRSFRTDVTRRTVVRSYTESPVFGAPRGRRFEDLIPVGARVTAVNAIVSGSVRTVWLTYERNGDVRQTPQRGDRNGRAKVFKLKKNEKIIGIHGWGRARIDALTIATNLRTHTFGDASAMTTAEAAWYNELTMEQMKQYVGIGFTGRADNELRQLTLRIQVQGDDSFARARP